MFTSLLLPAISSLAVPLLPVYLPSPACLHLPWQSRSFLFTSLLLLAYIFPGSSAPSCLPPFSCLPTSSLAAPLPPVYLPSPACLHLPWQSRSLLFTSLLLLAYIVPGSPAPSCLPPFSCRLTSLQVSVGVTSAFSHKIKIRQTREKDKSKLHHVLLSNGKCQVKLFSAFFKWERG